MGAHQQGVSTAVGGEIHIILIPLTDQQSGKISFALGAKACSLIIKEILNNGNTVAVYGHHRVIDSEGVICQTTFQPTYPESRTNPEGIKLVEENQQSGFAREKDFGDMTIEPSLISGQLLNEQRGKIFADIIPKHVSASIRAIVYDYIYSTMPFRDIIDSLKEKQSEARRIQNDFKISKIYKILASKFVSIFFPRYRERQTMARLSRFSLMEEIAGLEKVYKELVPLISRSIELNLEGLENYVQNLRSRVARPLDDDELFNHSVVGISAIMSGELFQHADTRGSHVISVCEGCPYNCPQSSYLVTAEMILASMGKVIQNPKVEGME